jgi:hypothetical protein
MEKKLMQTEGTFNQMRGKINKFYFEVDKNTVRKAKCSCGMISESNPKLPFFKAQPQSDFDRYYCGCWGWD